MSEWHERMLWQCSHLLATYDASTQSVEEHVTNFIQAQLPPEKKPQDGIQVDADHTFLKEVFSGCVQYSSAISIILEGFYNRDGKNTLRSELPKYHVLCYLALFRLDELGVAQFRKFVQGLEVTSAHKFLSFFLEEKNLKTWVKDGWITIYDSSFVQTKLLNPLLRWLEDLQGIIKHLQKKIDNQLKPPKVTIPTTETRPFNLTQPKPRSVPMPEEIPKVQKHSPVPRSLYQPSMDHTLITRRREENRQQAEERLMEASRRQYACANPEKTHKTREVLKNITSEQDSKLDFERHRAKPIPSFLSKETPIKMNTAAILREGQLYQKQEAEEMKKLARLEAGTLNSGPFEEWQASMRRKDLEAQLAEVERRRLMGKLSYEEAILARHTLTMENRAKVDAMKKEAETLMQEYLEQKLQEEQMVRNLVDQTLEGHRNAKDVKKKLQESKRKIVQQVAAENRELMRQALEDAEADMRRKLELIHQIKAMEASPAPRQKLVDLTATAGARLLSEMSIAELRERLSLMKVSQKEAEEKKRDDILEAKQAKDQQLISTLECISKHRLEQTRSAAIKLEEKKKGRSGRGVPVPSTPQLSELQRQVEEKRQARLRSQDQGRLTGHRSGAHTATLMGQRRALEESRWQELEQTRERSARLLYGDKPISQAANRLNFNPVTMAM